MISFPDGFLWGAATAGHQVEGNNTASDHWVMEQVEGSGFAEPSGDAADHLHRYPEDLDLAAGAGLDAYRFSVEWARVEPERGAISQASLDHYRRVTEACVERGLTPVVTMNHWVLPIWFAREGGWDSDDAAARFAAYCAIVIGRLGDLVRWVCTLNESNVGEMDRACGADWLQLSPGTTEQQFRERFAQRIGGRADVVHPLSWPEGRGVDHIIEGHRQGRAAIKAARSDALVGWTLAVVDTQAAPGGEERARLVREAGYERFMEVSRDDDFIGVQTYSRQMIGPDGVLPVAPGTPVTQMGWEYYPDALGHAIRWASAVAGVPVLVTENGIATADDAQRIAYTRTALAGLQACLRDGIDVRGYLHWSLLDNFEWRKGFAPTFGLIGVDRTDFTRRPKGSLAWLGAVARTNGASLDVAPTA